MKIKLILLNLVLTVAACDKAESPETPGAPTQTVALAPFTIVDAATARKVVADGGLLLDVRTPSEYAAGHVDGAKNIPVQDLDGRLAELQQDQPTVVYCASGVRSRKAMEKLKAAGFKAVYDAGAMSNLK